MAACCSLKARAAFLPGNGGSGGGSLDDGGYNDSFDGVQFYGESNSDPVTPLHAFVLGAPLLGSANNQQSHFLGTIPTGGSGVITESVALADTPAAGASGCAGAYCPPKPHGDCPGPYCPINPTPHIKPVLPASHPGDVLFAGLSAICGVGSAAYYASTNYPSTAVTGTLFAGALLGLVVAWWDDRKYVKYFKGREHTRAITLRWIAGISALVAGAVFLMTCCYGGGSYGSTIAFDEGGPLDEAPGVPYEGFEL